MTVSKASTVFVVDDDEALRNTLVELFAFEGYRTYGFGTAEQLLESLLLTDFPDGEVCCVVTDVKMPGVGGIGLLQQLVNRRNVVIVMMSGAATVTDVIDAFQSGATEFLLKPFEMPKLLSTVRKMLAGFMPGDPSTSARAVIHHSGQALSEQERELIWREFNGTPS